MTRSETPLPTEPILLVGLGSLRGDDSVGLCIAHELSQCRLPGVRVRTANSPTQLFDWLEGVDHLIICDACESTAPAGQLHHWTWPTDELVQLRFSGSHDMSLPAVLAMADQLGQLPPAVTIWGVVIAADRFASVDNHPAQQLRFEKSSSAATVPELQKLLSKEISASLPSIAATIRSAITAT